MTRVLLVRHGETEWNSQRRLQGHLDAALTKAGRAQAKQVSNALADVEIDHIWSSDLGRAAHTCALAFEGRARTLHSAFRERRYGLFQGLTRDEVGARYPTMWARFRNAEEDFRPVGAESRREFVTRIAAALWSLHGLHTGETCAVVTHGGFIAFAAEYTSRQGAGPHQPLPPRGQRVENASVTELVLESGRWRLACFADTSHLLH
jgi:2,3-bisphosphoglycerate-dependent phosphoglycerate mutase